MESLRQILCEEEIFDELCHTVYDKIHRIKKKRDESTMMENKRSPFSHPNLTNDTLKERQEDRLFRREDFVSNTII